MKHPVLKWLPHLIIFALVILNFSFTFHVICHKNISIEAMGPYCPMEHTSAPLEIEKSLPDIALSFEWLALLFIVATVTIFSKKQIYTKILARDQGLIKRIKRMIQVCTHAGPSEFQIFIPQQFATHGM